MASGAQEKAAFRAWARRHHPDVGGDPEVFAAGLLAMREGRWDEFAGPDPLAGPLADPVAAEPHPHTPVYVQRTARGLAKIIVTAQRWNRRRRQPPRVR